MASSFMIEKKDKARTNVAYYCSGIWRAGRFAATGRGEAPQPTLPWRAAAVPPRGVAWQRRQARGSSFSIVLRR